MTCTKMWASSYSYFYTAQDPAEIHAFSGCPIKNNVYSLHLLSTYYVTDPVVKTSHTEAHLILTATSWGLGT